MHIYFAVLSYTWKNVVHLVLMINVQTCVFYVLCAIFNEKMTVIYKNKYDFYTLGIFYVNWKSLMQFVLITN